MNQNYIHFNRSHINYLNRAVHAIRDFVPAADYSKQTLVLCVSVRVGVFVWRATVQATQNHEMKACDAQFGG